MPTLTATMKNRLIFLPLVASALFIAAYYPALQILVKKWMGSEDYSHAFITLPIIFYIVWTKRAALAACQVKYSFLGLAMLAVATLFYIFALLTQVHTIILLAMLMAVIGAIAYVGGVRAVQLLLTPIILFAFLIPIPEQLYIQITSPLQLKVSHISEVVVQAVGVPIYREGNIMATPLKSFEVVEACSGMRSMMTLLTLSIVMGYFLLSKNASKLVLAAASVPTAIFVNIVRVVSMILLYHFFTLDLTDGAFHTLLGMTTFGIALITLYGIHRVLELCETRLK
ncbi:MAG: hypothetical protein VR64_23785 [Desulfatitalea sp. BRH_c12]|nr:MAG: hypothetical protein VR64_23785 [Desulfatitalea sp. BRH_c12]